MKEEVYEKKGNWNFDDFDITSDEINPWDIYKELRQNITKDSTCLELGCADAQKIIDEYPIVKEVWGTDLLKVMIENAKINALKRKELNLRLKVMDNTIMDVPDNYFDTVVARHTVTDASQVYKCLKTNGLFLVRGVDKADCADLKFMFQNGQGMHNLPISLSDYEQIVRAGFKEIKLFALPEIEYFTTKEELLRFLKIVPILEGLDQINEQLFDLYAGSHTTSKGVYLLRNYYGISARKK